MSVSDQVQVGLPYLVMASGLMIVMIGISIRRTHLVAWTLTTLTLIATLLSHVVSFVVLESDVVEPLDLFRIDGIALFFNVLFIGAALVTAIVAFKFLERKIRYKEEFYLLLLTATLGSMTLAAATHFASLILGLEIISISLYALIAYPEHERSPLEAGLKYMILSGVGSAAILFGTALIYAETGTLEFATVSTATDTGVNSGALYLIGQAFFWSGIAFKLSLVPFHIWTPDVYQGAPSLVTGFVATVSKGAVFAVLIRYVWESDVLLNETVRFAVVAMAITSMIVGNLLALQQKNFKRLLAYSSIAHMGYLMIALVIAAVHPSMGHETAMFYLAVYFVMTLAAFGAVTVISLDSPSELERVDDLSGLMWRRPIPAATLITAALALAGIPPTVGLMAKVYLVTAGIEGELWWLVGALVIGSAIGVYYYLRVVFSMITRPSEEGFIGGLPWSGIGTLLVLSIGMIALGIYPSPLIEFVQDLIQLSEI